jgi:hypothetical protein
VISALATRLVQTAPVLARGDIDALVDALRADGTALALAIARVVELIDEQLVDPGIALPALAEACDALCDPRSDAAALAAARYRVDTLVPVPDNRPRAVMFDGRDLLPAVSAAEARRGDSIDVPITHVRRRRT